MRLKVAILFIAFLLSGQAFAQSITNSGKEFWFAFPEMFDKGVTAADYWVNITSNQGATGTVSIPGAGFTRPFTVAPGGIQQVNFTPASLCWLNGSDSLFHRAIHITSNNDVVVYAVHLRRPRHEATLVLPNVALGKEYRITTYPSERIGNNVYESEFCVVSNGDSAEVEITPTADIRRASGVHPAGIPYTIKVPPNYVYHAQASGDTADLTGTVIRSLNDTNVAVYAGTEWAQVYCRTGARDPLLEVMYPTNTWGTNYFTIPTPLVGTDYIKVLADKDSTELRRDGTIVDTLNAGEFFIDTIQAPTNYTSDNPISVAQIMVSGNSNISAACTPYRFTDPSMVMVNPTDQMFLDSISFFAVDDPSARLDTHFVQIVTWASDTSLMFLDSATNHIAGWQTFGQNDTFSFVSLGIRDGAHRLETQGCGFLAYSIGMGDIISYAYATGVSLIDLSAQISFKNAITGTDTICIADSVQFESVVRGNPQSFRWDFGDGTTSVLKNPKHAYSVAGNYTVQATIQYSCTTDVLIDTIVVPPPPAIELGPDTVLCEGDTLRFTANTREFKALWQDGSTDSTYEVTMSGFYQVTVSNFCGADTDSVNVIIRDTVQNFSLGKDTAFCDNATLVLKVPLDTGQTVIWDNGSTDTSRTITRGGLIWAEIKNACDVKSDTIRVGLISASQIDAGGTIYTCNADTVRLGGNPTAPPKSRFAWSSPEVLNDPSIANPTTFFTLNKTYYLNVVDSNGCAFEDSVVVKRYTIAAKAETAKCANDSVQLRVVEVDGYPPFTYKWSPSTGVSDPTISQPKVHIDSSSTLTVFVTDSAGCSDSVRVEVPISDLVKADFDVLIQADCDEAIATTNNKSINGNTYKWLVGEKVVSEEVNARIPLIFGEKTNITLLVSSSDGCRDSSVLIRDVLAFEEYYSGKVPTVFTPNGDGINDEFDARLGQRLEQCSEIKIYNRWGQLMFESVGNSHTWNGRTFAGEECAPGVYFYTLNINGAEYKGHVTLIR